MSDLSHGYPYKGMDRATDGVGHARKSMKRVLVICRADDPPHVSDDGMVSLVVAGLCFSAPEDEVFPILEDDDE